MSACVRSGSSYGGAHQHGSSIRETGRVGTRPGGLSFRKNPAVRQRFRAISSAVPAVPVKEAAGGRETEKLDHWMRESVVEIVKSLRSGDTASPLMVHVYGGGAATRIRTERAEAEDWGRISRRWSSGVEPLPEGIILVEELKDETEAVEGSLGNMEGAQGINGENTKAWGVLLMGRGEEGGVANFLLKTTDGGSHSKFGGHSCNCTHFSLVKVKSFRESTRSLLTNCWLA